MTADAAIPSGSQLLSGSPSHSRKNSIVYIPVFDAGHNSYEPVPTLSSDPLAQGSTSLYGGSSVMGGAFNVGTLVWRNCHCALMS